MGVVKIGNRDSKKVLIKGGIGYTVGSFLLRGMSFFTAPLFVNMLTTNDYGLTSIYNTWLTLIGTVVMLQISSSIGTARKDFDDVEYEKYKGTILTLGTFSFLTFLILAIIFVDPLSKMMTLSKPLVILMVVNSFFVGNVTFISKVCVHDNNYKKYLFISFMNVILNTALSVVFIMGMSDGNKYIGRILGTFVSTAIIGGTYYISVIRKCKYNIDFKVWKYCLAISVPMIFHVISSTILSQSDRVMINSMVNSSEAGIYSFIYNVGSILLMITASLNNAWVPWYYNNLKQGKVTTIVDMEKKYMLLVTIITLGLMFVSPEIVKIMAFSKPEYWKQIGIVPLIILAGYMSFLYTFAVNYELYIKKTRMIAIASALTAIMNLGLNYLLIPKYGAMGATIATLIAYVVLYILHQSIVSLKYKHHELAVKVHLIYVAIVVMFTIIFYIFENNIIIRWGIALAIAVYAVYKLQLFKILGMLKKKADF